MERRRLLREAQAPGRLVGREAEPQAAISEESAPWNGAASCGRRRLLEGWFPGYSVRTDPAAAPRAAPGNARLGLDHSVTAG